MYSNSIDNEIIERFLATSALYLGVKIPDQQEINFETPATALAPERVSMPLHGDRIQPQHSA